jgi:hypothetical protein
VHREPNRTAANLKHLIEDAGIQPRDMVPWNAYPWFTRHEQVSAELELGIEPWLQLTALLPALRVIMLLGRAAKDGWERLLTARASLTRRPSGDLQLQPRSRCSAGPRSPGTRASASRPP